jgi:hypothetical protein
MSKLGDVLERLYGPVFPYTTIRAEVRHWENLEVAEKVRLESDVLGGRRKLKPDKPAAPTPRTVEATLKIWLSRPSRGRIEKTQERQGQIETSLTVTDGETWATRDSEGHVESGKSAKGTAHANLTDAERHFDAAMIREFFQNLALELVGTTRSANRDCIRVRAVLRPDGRLWPHWLPKEAEEYEFHIDSERGLLLAIISKRDGQPFEIDEVLEIAYDEKIDDGLFSYSPAVGEQLREPIPVAEHLTLEAAVARVPFTVLIPTRIPGFGGEQFEVIRLPARPKSPREYLWISYGPCDEFERLWLHEGATIGSDHDEYEWERIEKDSREILISDPGATGQRKIYLKQEGTHIDIDSDLDRDRLIDLALSLCPVTPQSR